MAATTGFWVVMSAYENKQTYAISKSVSIPKSRHLATPFASCKNTAPFELSGVAPIMDSVRVFDFTEKGNSLEF